MQSKLWLLVSKEYSNDVRSKSFWISTFLLPLLIVGFGAFIAYLSSESEVMHSSTPNTDVEMSVEQGIGMTTGVFLVIFIMMYGAMIFNKVKAEKTNRIVEVLVSSIPGRTVMISKVISVVLFGLTQMLVWLILIVGLVFAIQVFIPFSFEISTLLSPRVLKIIGLAMLYFLGGFAFYGSLFSICGAVTDRNNENQGYMTIVTMTLMVSMYLAMYSVDNAVTALAQACFYIPFTSPAVGSLLAIGNIASWWQILISLVLLFGSSYFFLIIAGKIYTSAVMLKGKKLSLRDIRTFIRAK